MKLPLQVLAQDLDDAWQMVDAMWRIELRGDVPLTQQWREARNRIAKARQRLSDLRRLAEHGERYGKRDG